MSWSMAVFKKRKIIVFLLTLCALIVFRNVVALCVRDFGYLLRPIWDSPPNIPERLITHFYTANLSPEKLCVAHGWKPRSDYNRPRVIDAFIFSVELDMLEIRLKELWNVVDTFVIVEADRTFTGTSKPLVFRENLGKFEWAKEKIVHFVVTDLDEKPTTEFHNEGKLRGFMTSFVNQVKPNKGDLILASDIDEIPYFHTLQLLKDCEGYSNEIHLELNNYLYSFEFPVLTKNWKPHVTVYDEKSYFYHHGKRDSNERLADAGWHCSFCFRYLSQFVFKMTSYSHSDRVTRKELLEESQLQKRICEGKDIFDMFPEAYTYKELISQVGNMRKSGSTIGLPEYVVENHDKFKFLLPGGCIREKEHVNDQYSQKK